MDKDYNGTCANPSSVPEPMEIKSLIEYFEKVKLGKTTIPHDYVHKPLEWKWFEKFMNRLGWYRKFTAYVIESESLRPRYPFMNMRMDLLDPYKTKPNSRGGSDGL